MLDLDIRLKVPYAIRQRREWVVAVCEELDLAGQGATQEAAIAALRESIQLFMESCLERGVLDAALREMRGRGQAHYSRVQ